MNSSEADFVKQQVAAHWGRRAPGFDDGFGHSIRTPAEQFFARPLVDRPIRNCHGLPPE